MKRETPAPSNVLLRVAAGSSLESDSCIDLLTSQPPADQAVLHVTFEQSPDDRLSDWHDHGHPSPARTGVIAVGEGQRSTGQQSVPSRVGSTRLTVIENGADLSALRTAIEDYLSAWSGEGHQIVLCFRSLTTLLEQADSDAIVGFFRSVTAQVSAADAIAHYHVDRAADEGVSATLESQFDEVLEPTDARSDPPQTDIFRTHIDAGERPSEAIIRGVAAIEGVDPVDLDIPLYHSINADDLDLLLTSNADADSIRVQFPYHGFLVTATTDAVTLQEQPS